MQARLLLEKDEKYAKLVHDSQRDAKQACGEVDKLQRETAASQDALRLAEQRSLELRQGQGDGPGAAPSEACAHARAGDPEAGTEPATRFGAAAGEFVSNFYNPSNWQPNEDILTCAVCECDMRARSKHHCRVCGLGVCDPCSSHRKHLRGWARPAQKPFLRLALKEVR